MMRSERSSMRTSVGGLGGRNRRMRSRVMLLAVAGSAAMLSSRGAVAANLTWDISGNGTGSDGSGNWDTTDPFWATGTLPDTAWINDGSASAFFGSGGTAGTVNVIAPIQVSGITFNSVASGDYLISASGAGNGLTLTNSAINVNYAPTSPQVGPTISAAIGGTVGLNLNSTGAGTLTLSGANTYTGNTIVSAGTLNVNAGGTLGAITNNLTLGASTASTSDTATANANFNTSVTVGNLTVNPNTTTPNVMTVASGQTLTVNGTFLVGQLIPGSIVNTVLNTYTGATDTVPGSGGTLTVNDPTAITSSTSGLAGVAMAVGLSSGSTANPKDTATVDLSALSNFNLNSPLNGLYVGGGTNILSKLTLAANNTINVSVINVGTSNITGFPGNENANAGSTVTLGAGTTLIETNALNLGNGKSNGVMTFATGATGASVTITGTNGVGATAITLSNENVASSTGATAVSSLLLAGNSANVNASTVIVGEQAGVTKSQSQGAITFDQGTFGAAAMELAVDVSGNNATGGPVGTFTLGTTGSANNATLNVGSTFWLADLANSTAGTRVDTGSFIINGGTANIGGNMVVNVGVTGIPATVTANTTLTLAGGTLNMMGHSIGTAAWPITNLNLASSSPAVLENLGGTGIISAGNTAGGLVYSGGSTLILDGTNSYTGGTTINSGVLQVGQASSVALTQPLGATGSIVTNNAVLNFASNSTMTISNNIGGGGTVNQNGTGVTTLSGTNGYSGNTTINAGTLAITGSLTASNVNISGGTLSGNGNISGTVTLNSGALTSGAVPASNSGTLNIGGLTVNGGTLAFDLGSSTNNTINVSAAPVFSGGSLAFTLGGPVSNGQIYTIITTPSALSTGGLNMSVTSVGRTTFTPSVSGNNLVVKIGGGPANLTWNNSGNPTPDDGITWDVQTNNNWKSTAVSGVATQFYTADNVTFSDAGNNLVTIPGQVQPTSVTFTNSTAHSYTFSGAGGITGGAGLLIGGGGTVTLQTANTYSGNTNVNSGTLNLNSGGSISSASANLNIGGGTVNILSSGSVGSATTTLTSGALNVGSGGSISSPNLNVNGGAVSVTSGGSITGANATVAGGASLTVASGGNVPSAWNLTDNGTVTFSSPTTTIGTLNGIGVVNLNSDTLSIAGGGTVGAVLQDGGVGSPGSLNVTGGTLVLTGANLYTGATTIGAGATLQIGAGGSTGSLSAATAITANGSLVYNLNATPTPNLSPNVALASGGAVVFNSPGALNANISNIVGAGSVQQNGAGTTSITGTLTNFTGAYTVSGGTLLFNYAAPTTITNAFTTAGATGAIANVGKLTLAGTFTIPGGVGNEITLNVSPVAGTLPDGVAADVETTGSLNITLNKDGIGIVKTGSGTLSIAGTTDDGSMGVLVNAGTVILNKTATTIAHAIGGGGLTINSGALGMIGTAGSGTEQFYNAAGGLTINHGGTFDLNGSPLVAVDTLTLGDATGAGTLTDSVPGTAVVLVAGTAVGGTDDAGTATAAIGGIGLGVGGGTVTVPATSTLEIQNNGGKTAAGNHVLTDAGLGTVFLTGVGDNNGLEVNVTTGTLVLEKASSPAIHAASTVTGVSPSAFLVMGPAASGGDQIYNGTTAAAGATQLDYGVFNMDGTFDLNGEGFEAFDKLTGTSSGAVVNAGALTELDLGTNNGLGTIVSDFSGSIQGNIFLKKVNNGTSTVTTPVILSGANTYNGGTTISNGVLQIGDGGSNGTLGTGPVEVDDTLAFDRSDSALVVTNGVSGNGTISQIGTGTTTLSGTNSFSGNIIATAGKLIIGPNTVNSSGISPVALNSVTVASGGTLALGNAAASGSPTVNSNRTVLVTPTLIIPSDGSGTLDLGANDLIVSGAQEPGYVTIEAAVATGRGSNGAWTGGGITSSTVAATANLHNKALGVVVNDTNNNVNGTLSGSAIFGSFDGVNVNDGDVLVKYTYDGDADLNGVVNAADYIQIDNGFTNHLSGWYNGDFNYDGVINGDDYTLIDNAFNTQGSASLAAVPAGPLAMVASNTDQIAGAGSSVVPEPATFGMLGVGAVGLMMRRRRRSAR
jgi:fibronectin-binding autotransporter adhesin